MFIIGVNETVNNLYFPGVVDTVQKKTKKPKIYRRCQRHRQKMQWYHAFRQIKSGWTLILIAERLYVFNKKTGKVL
jgi:hypothetical protein